MAPIPSNHHYLVILCGGSGPRLWPLSTANQPKQFLKILSPNTLLENTIKRCLKIVDKKHLIIVSNKKYQNLLKRYQLTILYEPEKKNTTMAILYAASYISKLDPQAIITTTPADHYIAKVDQFVQDIKTASQIAAQGTIVTIGITPDSPNPSFGYIKIRSKCYPYQVSRFIEKPSVKKAKVLIHNHRWYWNSGLYTFQINTLIHALRIHQPLYLSLFEQLQSATSSQKIKNIYTQSPSLAFDRAISEQSHNLTMVKSHFVWSDLGEWGAIFQQAPKNKQHNAILNQSDSIAIDSSNCLVYGQKDKLIGLIGVNNLSIIDTPRGLLICPHILSARVRDLVATIVADPHIKHFFLM